MSQNFSQKICQPKYLLLLVLGAYFFFGFHHLTQFVTADEHYWIYERIPQYWEAVTEGRWKKTFINDKPGVSLALVSGTGLLFEPHPEKHFSENHDRTLVYATGDTASLYRAFRLPILITNSLLLLYIFWVIGRLTNPWIALFTTIFTAFSPILLGVSQIINPDALLWSLGAAALFSSFAFLTFEEKKYLFLTILFTGFALLTKYVAFILFPFYLALAVFRFLFTPEKNLEQLSRLLRQDLASCGIVVAGSMLLFCLFLPAILLDSKYFTDLLMTIPDKEKLAILGGSLLLFLLIDTFVLKNKWLWIIRTLCSHLATVRSLVPFFFLALFTGLITIRNFFPSWDIFTLIPFDIKDLSDARYYTSIPNFFEAFLLEWNPLIFSLTPVTLVSFIALIATLFHKEKNIHAFYIYTLLFFFIIYTVLLIHSNVLTTPRYSILLYPLFAFLAGLGIWRMTEKIAWPHTKLATTGIIFLGSLMSLIASTPFYFNYTNFLLPKTALIHDAWGYGGYEAAQYLNNLPDAKNLTVWIDYYGVCEFFVGRCLNAYTFDPTVVKPDYYVLTRRGQMRFMSRADRWERLSGLTAHKYYGKPHPDWELLIDDRPGNFVKVVRVAK